MNVNMSNEERFEILIKSNQISIATKLTLKVLYYEYKKLNKALTLACEDISWDSPRMNDTQYYVDLYLKKAGEEIEKPKLV